MFSKVLRSDENRIRHEVVLRKKVIHSNFLKC